MKLIGRISERGKRILNRFFKPKKGMYYSKRYMSHNEIKLYNNLKKVLSDDFYIDCQVPLSAIIGKKKRKFYKNNNCLELFRTIDFGIFDKDTYIPILLIELNDSTHNDNSRIERDIRVNAICESCDVPLITFWIDDIDNYDKIRNNTLKAIYSNDSYVIKE